MYNFDGVCVQVCAGQLQLPVVADVRPVHQRPTLVSSRAQGRAHADVPRHADLLVMPAPPSPPSVIIDLHPPCHKRSTALS